MGEHISQGICVSQVGKHISLGICVSQVREHISLGICVSHVGQHISLGICVSQVGEHISLGICYIRNWDTLHNIIVINEKKRDLSLHRWGPEFLMSLNVLIISFVFLWVHGPADSEKTLDFSVGLPWTVFAFVSLMRDNIIEQYMNTFLETLRPNVIQTAPYCCFKKFRIKRHPNRPSLDYPLNLTKSTNHKIRKRKWMYNKENSKFIWPVRKHAI